MCKSISPPPAVKLHVEYCLVSQAAHGKPVSFYTTPRGGVPGVKKRLGRPTICTMLHLHARSIVETKKWIWMHIRNKVLRLRENFSCQALGGIALDGLQTYGAPVLQYENTD